MKNIHEFIREDQTGHIERSGEEVRANACRKTELSLEQRCNYFYGISVIFPMMLLSHYYTWLTEKDADQYMEVFVPEQEKKYGPEVKALLDCVYQAPESNEVWLSAVSSYLSSYPYTILMEFCNWTMTPEQVKKAQTFIHQDRVNELPQLLCRLAECVNNAEERVKLVVWLGTVYPFELLERMHCYIFDEK